MKTQSYLNINYLLLTRNVYTVPCAHMRGKPENLWLFESYDIAKDNKLYHKGAINARSKKFATA